MNFIETSIPGAYKIELNTFSDDRGCFSRTYCKDTFSRIGFRKEWVQHNHSFTKKMGTLRGLHYQKPPFTEAKLVRCISGTILDVIVDLRRSSPTYLQWCSIELSAENKLMLFIPEGLAHGFQTLTDNAEVLYCHSESYHPEAEAGILYNDPKIDIKWPLDKTEISVRDQNYPLIDDHFKGITTNNAL